MRKLASFILLLLFANVQPSAMASAPVGMEKAADQAHDDVVAGTVLDTNGDPLAGVTVQ